MNKLLWVDLEMTGLDPERDVLLEVAAIVTDFEFNILDSYQSLIVQDKKIVQERMAQNPWWKEEVSENMNKFIQDLDKGLAQREVEQQLIQLVSKHFDSPANLAGNSIHMDRLFIRRHLPKFAQKLHYRMLDVSSWKLVMKHKYGLDFEKQNTHRAHDDIMESIAELKHYLEHFHS